MMPVAILSKETQNQGQAKEAAAVAKAKAENKNEKAAWIAMTYDKESGCESEEESDDESVGEEKEVSMPQLMDLSE
jgi:hypothetical protein